jgi:hypothetical protein
MAKHKKDDNLPEKTRQPKIKRLPAFINYSNHPYNTWSPEQRAAATANYSKVIDRAFPHIDPKMPINKMGDLLGREYEALIDLINEHSIEGEDYCAVHIMGEQSFCYNMVELLHEQGIRCYVSTTERISEDKGDGQKTTTFKFCQFRAYADYELLVEEAEAELAEMDATMKDLQKTLKEMDNLLEGLDLDDDESKKKKKKKKG